MSAVVSFLLTLVLIRFLKPRAEGWGLMDHPKAHRSHKHATPVVGGIAMFVGASAGMLWVSWAWPPTGALIVSGAVMLGFGIWDDRHDTSYLFRFVGQLMAVVVMIKAGGVVLDDLGHLTSERLLPLNRWSVALSIFGAVGVINAINMSDGMDGLAGSLSLVAVAALLVVCLIEGLNQDAIFLSLVASAIVAFLLFNARLLGRTHGSVFMGDAGSMWLGLVLAWFLIKLSQGEARTIAPVTALWVIAVPLFDAVGSLVRRALRGRSPFRSDRTHYHHYLLALGLTVNQTLLATVACAAALALIGIGAGYSGVPERTMFYAFLALFAVYLALMEFVQRRVQPAR